MYFVFDCLLFQFLLSIKRFSNCFILLNISMGGTNMKLSLYMILAQACVPFCGVRNQVANANDAGRRTHQHLASATRHVCEGYPRRAADAKLRSAYHNRRLAVRFVGQEGPKLPTCHIHSPYLPHTCSIPALYLLYTCSIPALYLLHTCSIPALYLLYTCSLPQKYPKNTPKIPQKYPPK